jgi:hypothetical protein
MVLEIPLTTDCNHFSVPPMFSCIRCRSFSRISFSLAAMRLPIVSRRTVKYPFGWLVPQIWVKPKKLKVSGFHAGLSRRYPAKLAAPQISQNSQIRENFAALRTSACAAGCANFTDSLEYGAKRQECPLERGHGSLEGRSTVDFRRWTVRASSASGCSLCAASRCAMASRNFPGVSARATPRL